MMPADACAREVSPNAACRSGSAQQARGACAHTPSLADHLKRLSAFSMPVGPSFFAFFPGLSRVGFFLDATAQSSTSGM